MNYRETFDATLKIRANYVDGINRVIKKRQDELVAARREYTHDIFANTESYRNEFISMLGWPLVGYEKEEMPEPICEHLSSEDGYDIYRMHFEVLEGFTLSGIFLKIKGDEKRPFVICQHGGEGTPELITGIYGDTGTYHDMVHRVMAGGINTFSPQLLLWKNDYGVPYGRTALDAQLKNIGGSITALEVFAITRVIDYFEKQSYVSTIGMVGLSYGGFYTLYTTAADKRIKSALSCSFFNSRAEISWADWTWKDWLTKFNDAEVACLIYPRKLYIAVGDKDALFKVDNACASFETVREMSKDIGLDWVKFKVFDGIHEFIKENDFIEELIRDLQG